MIYDSVDEYFGHYVREYCQGEVYTADEIRVHFTKKTFDHAFYERSAPHLREKDLFSTERAERVDWIRAALETPDGLYFGWDKTSGSESLTRRVDLFNRFAIVLQLKVGKGNFLKAEFITCYPTSPDTLKKISQSPWVKELAVKELSAGRRPKPVRKAKRRRKSR